MTHFALHLFPESGLASSLITTVWIGVFVTCFFNLRFGWNKSGLIIPGYLVPLLILKPWSAVAVIIEGLVTFLIVKMISEFGSFSKMWSNYFGRDRFFLLFIVAIGVRIVFDEYLFPQLTIALSNYCNIDFVYQGGLYSIGLVIVALTANHFWNSGLKRGFPHLIVILFCTYIIIQFVLIPFTNFRLNNIVYLYEDIATSIAASPKAYIILTITAFCASRMNLLYGWEFSGIIIPALLALQWYFPWKIASSIFEAALIYGIATLILRSRFFVNSTIEGARKILLFFNIAFIYKILLGFILPMIMADAPVTDAYGLGYMLTSLIAIKMYDKKIGIKMTRSILHVSIVSIILATIIGFALMYLPNPYKGVKAKRVEFKKTASNLKIKDVNKDIKDVVDYLQVSLYGNHTPKYKDSSKDLDHFQTALLAGRYFKNTKSDSSLEYMVRNLEKIQFDVNVIQDKYLLFYDKSSKKSRGIYVVSLDDNADDTIISVPYPIGNPALVASALNIFKNTNAQGLAISSGVEKDPGDIIKKDNTIFHEFIKFFSYRNDIVTLAKNTELVAELMPQLKINPDKSYVYSFSYMDKALADKTLNHFADNAELISDPSVFKVYKNLDYGYLALITQDEILDYVSKIPKYKNLASNNMHKILKQFNEVFTSNKSSNKGMFSYFSNMFSSKKVIKRKEFDISRLSYDEADYLDKNVVAPLTELAINQKNIVDSKKFISQVKLADFAASDIGYSTSMYTSKSKKVEYIVLNKNQQKNKTVSGAYFFKATNSNPYILEIFNLNNPISLKIGNLLTKKLNPSVILFAISPFNATNIDNLVDISIPTKSTFNLVNQVAMRQIDSYCTEHAKEKKYSEPQTIQVRVLPKGKVDYPDNTIYFATYHGKYKYSQLSDKEKDIFKLFKGLGFNIEFANGSTQLTAGMEAIKLEQAKYMSSTLNFNFMALWFSPNVDLSLLKSKNTAHEKSTSKTEKTKSNNQNTKSKEKMTQSESKKTKSNNNKSKSESKAKK